MKPKNGFPQICHQRWTLTQTSPKLCFQCRFWPVTWHQMLPVQLEVFPRSGRSRKNRRSDFPHKSFAVNIFSRKSFSRKFVKFYHYEQRSFKAHAISEQETSKKFLVLEKFWPKLLLDWDELRNEVASLFAANNFHSSWTLQKSFQMHFFKLEIIAF